MANGDEGDPASTIVGSGTDMGGGMFTEPALMPEKDDDDDLRRVLRRTPPRRARRIDTRHKRRRT